MSPWKVLGWLLVALLCLLLTAARTAWRSCGAGPSRPSGGWRPLPGPGRAWR